MKRKMIILLTLILLFTTGCRAEYNLKIEDGIITETTNFYQEANDEHTKNYLYELSTYEYPIFYDEEFIYYDPTKKKDGNTYYTKTLQENNGLYVAKYIAEYNMNNFDNSQSLNTAYKNFSVGYDKGEYYIIANNIRMNNDIGKLDNLRVTIELADYEVTESNEQKKDGNKYIWDFDESSNGTINIKFKKNGTQTEEVPKKSMITSQKNNYGMYILAGIILIVSLTIYFIYTKLKNNDEMDD